MNMGLKMWIALAALAVSTVLNALYYIRVIAIIFSKTEGETVERRRNSATYNIAMIVFIIANVMLGLFYQPIMDIISTGMNLL